MEHCKIICLVCKPIIELRSNLFRVDRVEKARPAIAPDPSRRLEYLWILDQSYATSRAKLKQLSRSRASPDPSAHMYLAWLSRPRIWASSTTLTQAINRELLHSGSQSAPTYSLWIWLELASDVLERKLHLGCSRHAGYVVLNVLRVQVAHKIPDHFLDE